MRHAEALAHRPYIAATMESWRAANHQSSAPCVQSKFQQRYRGLTAGGQPAQDGVRLLKRGQFPGYLFGETRIVEVGAPTAVPRFPSWIQHSAGNGVEEIHGPILPPLGPILVNGPGKKQPWAWQHWDDR